jgi:hypothetical protein
MTHSSSPPLRGRVISEMIIIEKRNLICPPLRSSRREIATTPFLKYICVAIVIPLRGFFYTLLLTKEGKRGEVIRGLSLV